MSTLSLRGLEVRYPLASGSYHALKGLDLDVEAGEFFTVLGPSGCGKTTALRSIAGLEEPTAGEITIGGRVMFSAKRGLMEPPNRRDISMVFQSYAIRPHMSVGENVAFPLESQRLPRAERDRKVLWAREHLCGAAARPLHWRLDRRDATRQSRSRRGRGARAAMYEHCDPPGAFHLRRRWGFRPNGQSLGRPSADSGVSRSPDRISRRFAGNRGRCACHLCSAVAGRCRGLDLGLSTTLPSNRRMILYARTASHERALLDGR